jgi:hypothetical protein
MLISKYNILTVLSLCLFSMGVVSLHAQDSTAAPVIKKVKPVKYTFEGEWIIDNQTVMVPVKGSLEMAIQHRFGVVSNGSSDLYGIFAPSNIRLSLNYAPIKKLFVGAGITKERMQMDINAKYAIVQQTPGVIPISVTYYGNVVMDCRNRSNFRYDVDRFSFFHELMFARKITKAFSAQVAPTLSWFNNVEAYVDSKGEIQGKMKNVHLAFNILGRYMISSRSAVIAGYDQPLTQHPSNNPHPNVSFGFETTTSSHTFQVFLTNYFGLVPQSNNFYNQNDYTKGQFLIGFNITRLWNY